MVKKARYKNGEERGELDRLTLSLTKSERSTLDDKAKKLNIPVSRLVLENCTVLRPGAISPDLTISLDDLEFMVSIVKMVGVPLALNELLSLLQKHGSREISKKEG